MPSKSKYGIGSKKKTFEKELPSGETCLMRRLTPDDLLEMGVMDQIDSMQAIVAGHIARAGGQASSVADIDASTEDGRKLILDIMKDKTKWEALQGFMNTVVCAAVVEPQVFPEPPADQKRDPELLYIREVDLMDRIVVMTEAVQGMITGVKAMEPFRPGASQAVAGVPAGQDVRDAPERAGRANGAAGAPVL